jgi:hypothetical protein
MQQQISENLKRKSHAIEAQTKELIDNHHQRQLIDAASRPYTAVADRIVSAGGVMQGASHEPQERLPDRYIRPTSHETGKYTNKIIEELQQPTQQPAQQ